MTDLSQFLNSFSGKTVGVIGAGISNMPLISMLRTAGIEVTVHDTKTSEELSDQYATLAMLGVRFSLGDGYLDNCCEDIIFRTPGVHPKHLENAKNKGSVITSEMEFFFEVCPCPIIGITGSDGKTTTTTLVSEMLRTAGYTVHLGGNIGQPLLPHVGEMTAHDIAVVELSSFQLMGMKKSPHIAAITNLTPNHLDYHADFKEYVMAKTEIYKHQTPNDFLILNLDDPVSQDLNVSGVVNYISKRVQVENGAFLKDDRIHLSKDGVNRSVLHQSDIRIPGAHNVYNVMMAAAIVQDYCSDEHIGHVACSFPGVEHRIEFVREVDGVRYYNDSIASSPTRTIAGLSSFSQKLILIAGGYDKNIPYNVLGTPICEHVKALILTGATADKIEDAVHNASLPSPDILRAETLEQAVLMARDIASSGDIVIMSPASASFDRFKNFMERGEVYKALVDNL